MKRRIYVDTSVIGGCFDRSFREASRQLFDRFRSGADILVVSSLTLGELVGAPEAVRNVLESVPSVWMEEIEVSDEARTLADRYIEEHVVGESMRADAQHIAVATLQRVDILVSWNFRHIVNLNRIHGFNAVNLRLGYPLIEIRTPREVIPYEERRA